MRGEHFMTDQASKLSPSSFSKLKRFVTDYSVMAEGRYAFLNSVAHKNFMDQYN
jgi:hypothetical protein